jgi:hypothetical protein
MAPETMTITVDPRGLFITAAVFLVILYASSAGWEDGEAPGTFAVLAAVGLELLMWFSHAETRDRHGAVVGHQ